MKSHDIALIGVGQIGSRHLQGLVRSKNTLRIAVADPSADSLTMCAERMEEVTDKNPETTVTFGKEIPLKSYTLAIIATHAQARLAALKNLLDRASVGSIVFEKILFSRRDDFKEAESLLAGKKIRAWVNCPRRTYPFYQGLKSSLHGPISVQLQGGGWGLGCNAIHFIDLFSFFCGSSVYQAGLQLFADGIFPSKRKGNYEISGALHCDFGNAGVLSMTAYKAPFPMSLLITDKAGRYLVDEAAREAHAFTEKRHSVEKIEIPLQSQLTTGVVDSILMNNDCVLPAYDESMRLHLPFIDALEKVFRGAGLNMENGVPVT